MIVKNNDAANLILKREPQAAEQVFLILFCNVKQRNCCCFYLFLA